MVRAAAPSCARRRRWRTSRGTPASRRGQPPRPPPRGSWTRPRGREPANSGAAQRISRPPLAGAMAFLETEPLILIIIVVLVLFGATAIPKLARSMGRAKGEFTKARREFDLESAKVEAETVAGPSEAQVRKTARGLGIQEQGKS